MTLPERRGPWQKSSYSDKDNCVEVALGAVVGVRDTKDPEGGELDVPQDVWTAFVNHLKRR